MRKSTSVINLSVSLKEKSEKTSKGIPDLIDLAEIGINIPVGFIVTPNAYIDFLSSNHLSRKITDLLSTIHYERPDSLMQVANHIKKLVRSTALPQEFIENIEEEYKKMGGIFKKPVVSVAGKKANNIEGVLYTIKEIWLSRFDAKNLLYFHLHKKSFFENIPSIYVLKSTATDKKGELYTSDIRISSDANLTNTEINKIKEIGHRLRKHFYLPFVVTWVIENSNVFVVDLIPMTNTQKSYLVLVRHGESEWNAKGLWTGWTDVPLSIKGHNDAKEAGEQLKDIQLDIAFTSALLRAIQTLDDIKKAKGQKQVPTVSHKALNERDYGDLTGKNKWEIKKEFGEEQFMKWRRSWDFPLPNGESLKDVYERVLPYYKETILPKLKSGKNVIIAAHGNSLRALVKYLDKISDDDISKLEISVGQVLVYQIDEDGKVVGKEIRNQHENKV